MRRTGTALLLAAGLVAGCSSQPETPEVSQPEWVSQPPQQTETVHGVGSAEIHGSEASARQLAAEQARLDLIKQLQVKISGEFSSSTRIERGGETGERFTQQVADVVRSSVPEVELPGIRIQKTFVDEADQVVHAMAVLDRQQAEMALVERISMLELELEDYLGRPMTGSKLEQVRALAPALKLLHKREQLGRQLALVALPGRAGYSRLSPEQRALKRDIYRRLGDLVVQLQTASPRAEAMESTVLKALTDLGLRVGGQEQADLTLVLGFNTLTRQQDGTYYVYADSRISIKDAQDRVLHQLETQTKTASGNEEQAQRKAARQAAEKLGQALAEALLDS